MRLSTVKRVMVVGAGPYQVPALEAVKRLGYQSLAVDRNPEAPGMALADARRVIDIIDCDAVVQAAREAGISAVLTVGSDAALPAVSAVANALSLPGLDSSTLERCRDKLRLAQALEAAGLAHPRTRLARTADVTEFGLPCVIKPSSGAGGRGVSIVELAEQIAPALARAGERPLIQAFVDGLPIGVELFMANGVLAAFFAFNDQYRPGFVSPVGHSLPSRLSPSRMAQLRKSAETFAFALGIDQGPANLDLRWTAEGPVLIELNPRAGGSNIAELVSVSTGVDLAEAAVLTALGQDPLPALRCHETAPMAARLLMLKGRGRVQLGPNSLPPQVRIDARDGAHAPLAVEDWSLLGRVLTSGQTAELAEQHAEALATAIEDEIKVAE